MTRSPGAAGAAAGGAAGADGTASALAFWHPAAGMWSIWHGLPGRAAVGGALIVGALLLVAPSAAPAAKRADRGPSAGKLVAAIKQAKTPKQRTRAVTKLFGALNVQVRTPRGRALTKGSVVGRTVYLYDFGARSLGTAWKRGDRIPVSEVAGRLELAGLRPRGKSLSHRRLARAIAAGVRSGVKRRSLAMRVFHELGRRHAKKTDARKLRPGGSLDPIQAQLLYVSWAQLVQSEVVVRRQRARSSVLARATVKSPCRYIGEVRDKVSKVKSGGQDGLTGWGIGKVWDALVGGPLQKKLVGEAADKALGVAGKLRDIPLDGLHGAILAYSMRTIGPERVDPVHYNHADGDGHVLEIPVKVVMLDDLPERIDCGPLAGMKFPRKGPVPGVPVTWSSAALEEHGEVICAERCSRGPLGYTITTGADGTATLRLRLRTEAIPGVGDEREATSTTTALARYQEAFGSDPDKVSYWMQFIAYKDGMNLAQTRWWIRYHKEPRLTLNFSVWDRHTDDGSGDGELVTTADTTRWVTGSVPLAGQPDGTYTGSAPITWREYSRNDYQELYCTAGGKVGIQYTSLHAQPGTIVVDRLKVLRPAEHAGPLELRFHVPTKPVEWTRETQVLNQSDCMATPPRDSDFSSFRNRVTSGTGWTPGPAYDGGPGVIAYREVESSGAFSHKERWELVAERAE